MCIVLPVICTAFTLYTYFYYASNLTRKSTGDSELSKLLYVEALLSATRFDSELWLEHVKNRRNDVMVNLTGENVEHSSPQLISTIMDYFIDNPRNHYSRKRSMELLKTPQVDVVLELLGEKVRH